MRDGRGWRWGELQSMLSAKAIERREKISHEDLLTFFTSSVFNVVAISLPSKVAIIFASLFFDLEVDQKCSFFGRTRSDFGQTRRRLSSFKFLYLLREMKSKIRRNFSYDFLFCATHTQTLQRILMKEQELSTWKCCEILHKSQQTQGRRLRTPIDSHSRSFLLVFSSKSSQFHSITTICLIVCVESRLQNRLKNCTIVLIFLRQFFVWRFEAKDEEKEEINVVDDDEEEKKRRRSRRRGDEKGMEFLFCSNFMRVNKNKEVERKRRTNDGNFSFELNFYFLRLFRSYKIKF